MFMNSKELDALFNGASATMNGAANVFRTVSDEIGNIQNGFDQSRRYQTSASSPYPNGYNPYQRVTYGYAYADTSNYSPYQVGDIFGNNNQNPYEYYAGITDPEYGSLSSTAFGTNSFSGYGGNINNFNGNNNGGYWR